MKKRYLLDSDNPQQSENIESHLLQELEPLQPSTQQRSKIRAQLFKRIHDSAAKESLRITVRSDQGQWRKISSGVRAKSLHQNSRAFLLDIEPGASLPMHRHHEDEECVVLRGSASLGNFKVNAGDYHLARTGSRHGKIYSETGALLYLRGIPVGRTAEVARDLLTAFLPGEGSELITIRADEGEWSDLTSGISIKALYDHGPISSSLVRITVNTSWITQQQALAHDEEFLLLEGDVFVGDTLLQTGDWQFAPAGSESLPISTDKGALVFLRGAHRNDLTI